MMKRVHLVRALAITAASALLFSCKEPTSTRQPRAVERVEITPALSTLHSMGAETTLTVAAYDASGEIVSGQTFTWSSLNTSIATVDQTGRVTATGIGTALIVARAGTPADTAQVDVIPGGAAGTYYVAPGGSNTNAGTINAPWQTLAFALTRLQAGQTLYVRGGTYQENIRNPTIRAGRADARIRVAAYPGERPIIVGLLWLTRPSYWTLDGINVTWSSTNGPTEHMVKMTNGVGWIYENAELWGARSFAGLLVYGSISGEPADWIIRGNCVHDIWTEPYDHGNSDHNLYINTGAAAGSGLIERNILFNAPNGQNIKLGEGSSTPQPGDGAANITVRYNTMYRSLKNLMLADETHHITIERNIISTSLEDYAIRAYRLTGTANVFRNNVFGDFRQLQLGDTGYNLVTDGGGNLYPRDPRFDGVGCTQLRPTDTALQGYGRYAP